MRAVPGTTGKEGAAVISARRRFLFVWSAPAVFFLDRLLKAVVTSRYSEGEGFPVIPGIFHVTHVNNTGAAFGMMRGSTTFLAAVSVACIAFLAWSVWRTLSSPRDQGAAGFAGLLASSLVIGGAVSNLYDRVRFGYVIDYLDFRVWPVFNVADAAICVGVFLIGADVLRRRSA
jgi:signal peptidase II